MVVVVVGFFFLSWYVVIEQANFFGCNIYSFPSLKKNSCFEKCSSSSDKKGQEICLAIKSLSSTLISCFLGGLAEKGGGIVGLVGS